MSQQTLIEVKYGELRLVPVDPREPKKKRLESLAELLSVLRSVALSGLVLLSLAALIFLAAKDVFRKPVIIEEFSIPSKLSERGYSGVIVTNRIWDTILEAQDAPAFYHSDVVVLPKARQLDIVEPSTGFGLQYITKNVRALLGREQTLIEGEIVCSDADCSVENLIMRVRISTTESVRTVSEGGIGKRSLDQYIKDSAILALQAFDPFVVAVYLSRDDETVDRSREIAVRLVNAEDNQSAWAANLLGAIEKQAGDHKAAIEWYRRSIQLAGEHGPSDFALPHNGWGWSLYDRGAHREKIHDAIEHFKIAAELDMGFVSPRIGLGWSQYQLGEYLLAEQEFQAVTQADPDNASAWHGWGLSLSKQEDHRNAAERFERVTWIDSERASAWRAWGISLAKLGEDTDALEKFLTADKIDPDNASTLKNWGWSLKKLGECKRAIFKFRRASQIDPDDPSSWNGWANCHTELGQIEIAVAVFNQATKYHPNDANIWNDWAWGLAEVGRQDEALEVFEQLAKIETNDSPYVSRWAKALSRYLDEKPDDICSRLVRHGGPFLVAAGEGAPEWIQRKLEKIEDECASAN